MTHHSINEHPYKKLKPGPLDKNTCKIGDYTLIRVILITIFFRTLDNRIYLQLCRLTL